MSRAEAGVIAPFDICGELPSGTTVLEASAGTGKTWTIAALVTRYVAEGHARLEQMLVITFGRAASQELRERVREQLVAAERSLRRARDGAATDDDRADPLVGLLSEADDAELARRHERLQRALVGFDDATIATTHTFCQTVLRSLGVAGDTDAGAQLVDRLDELVKEVVDDRYLLEFRGVPEPALAPRDLLSIGREAVGDPQAELVADPDDEVAVNRLRLAREIVAETDLRKRRLGLLSYDDLLTRLAGALEQEDSPARTRMRDRWKVVLVDEFQDTDPVQWQVLDRAFSGHATMVLIGDPKQAIYAFRGGDVHTYLSAVATAGHQATLGTSYRSDAPLVDALQALQVGAALGDERIVVREVSAHHQGSRLSGLPHPAPFRLRVVDERDFGADRGKGVNVGPLREHVAADLAADIRASLGCGAQFDGRPLVPGDIAVLCQSHVQCQMVLEALAIVGVPAVYHGSGSVFASDAAQEWLALLEAMAAPHRSERVNAAAITSFFGRTGTEVATDEGLGTRLAEQLRDWAELLRRRGPAALLEAATSTHGLSARVLGQTGGSRMLTDLRHVAEVLHAEATRDQLGLSALLELLRDAVQEARTGAPERTRRLDSDAAAVQVLTIHGSKGLQYPVVHLPFGADLFVRKDDAVPLFHEDGRRRRDIGGGTPAHRALATDESLDESLRLLYVAMTRAQSQLVTWWIPASKNTPRSPLHRMVFGRSPEERDGVPDEPVGLRGFDDTWQHALRWQHAGGPHVERSEPAASPAVRRERSAPDLELRRWTRTIDHQWRRTSYTALSEGVEAVAARQVQEAAFASEPEAPVRDEEAATGRDGADGQPYQATLDDLLGLGVGASADAPAVPADEVDGEGVADTGVPSPMVDLPVGATFGSLVHAVLEHADPDAPERGGDLRAELLHHVHDQLLRWPVDLDPGALADALVTVCDSPLGPLAADRTLRQVPTRDRLREMDFELPLTGGDRPGPQAVRACLADLAPLLRRYLPEGDPLLPYADELDSVGAQEQVLAGYLTGSIDVALRVGDRYLVVDYKTNWLGGPEEPLTSEHYTPQRLAGAMAHSSYPLQALLYAVVLHRFLRWRLRGYDPAQHLGGVAYLYLRGMCGPDTPRVDGQPCGVFTWQPPVALVEAVSDLFDDATSPAHRGGRS